LLAARTEARAVEELLRPIIERVLADQRRSIERCDGDIVELSEQLDSVRKYRAEADALATACEKALAES
jgi:hypothetical protein